MEGNPLDRRAFLGLVGGVVGAGATGAGTGEAIAALLRTGGSRRPPGPPVPRTLAQAMRGPVMTPRTRGFANASHVYNERFDWVRPSAVAFPLDALDVRGAVRWAVAHGVRLVARSGGHSYAGYSTVPGGVVLDLSFMRGLSVDRRQGTATIGAGAQLIDMYVGLAHRGATVPGGSCPSVGIAGVTLGGGMGLAARRFGLTSDNLVSAQIVTADGRVRTVDRRTDRDLLWALRGGGGGNFGVVTQFTFSVHPLPRSAAWFFLQWPWSSASDALEAWLEWAPHARDELTSIFHLEAGGGTPAVKVTGQYLGPSSDLARLLAPITSVAGASASTGDQAYAPLQMRWAGCSHESVASCHTEGTRAGGKLERASFRAKSDYLARALSGRGRATLLTAIEARQRQPGSAAILFDSYGGAINRVAPAATAFVHRNTLCAMQYLTYGGGAAWLRATHASMRPFVSGQAYQNYIDAELSNWQRAYYGSNYSRLVAVQRRVDPQRHFRFPQAIGV